MPSPIVHNAQIRHGPLKPPNLSRSATATDTSLGQVFLECIASHADPSLAKWFFGDREITNETGVYNFSQEHQDGQRDKFSCEIKDLAKSMTGVYKLQLTSFDGRQNTAVFNLPLVGIEKCNWTNVTASLTMDPLEVRQIPPTPLVPIK
ncbi:unnamed protein product [Meloidogyne enterolobii]|uniref:Ig-like domain-containing protein n=6 Tax=Meloidogyne TaxID=189290 RepID=A0A914MFE1_MELIC|nr:unnamed protein product [Meloidogyne enterolobii]